MSKSTPETDHSLEAFDRWLGQMPVRPSSGFNVSLRQRIDVLQVVDLDNLIGDSVIMPRMGFKQRLHDRMAHDNRRMVAFARWQSWLSPLAAAAVLAFAFFAFQQSAPDPARADAAPDNRVAVVSSVDEELASIFALAANLPAGGDITKLEGVEALAFFSR